MLPVGIIDKYIYDVVCKYKKKIVFKKIDKQYSYMVY